MKAMLFAAGLGTRLGAITASRPKALVEVCGEPMLGRVLRKLQGAGVTEVVVNVHHFADMVEQWLAENTPAGMTVRISDERKKLLDTGGGLLHARPLLEGPEPVLLHNVDILSDLPLNDVELEGDATLMVSQRESSRQLVFGPDMRLTGWVNLTTGETKGDASGLRRAFSGIHVVSGNIFDALQRYADQKGSDIFSLTPFYVDMARELRIYGREMPAETRWFDIGKPASLAAAERSLCADC